MHDEKSQKVHLKKSTDELIDEIKRLNRVICSQQDAINLPDKQGSINPSEIFTQPFICYEPEEVKRIRKTLGESPVEFGKRLGVSDSAVKAYETPRFHEDGKTKRSKHAECLGPAAKLIYWAAVVANERGSSKNNLIRLATR